MKVRHKQRGQDDYFDIEVVDEGERFFVGYHWKTGNRAELGVFSKEVYKPVKEETWRDVTVACDVRDGDIEHGQYAVAAVFSDRGYRLRKVEVSGAEWLGDGWAFIVEKRNG
jgi:hypothetical protein